MAFTIFVFYWCLFLSAPTTILAYYYFVISSCTIMLVLQKQGFCLFVFMPVCVFCFSFSQPFAFLHTFERHLMFYFIKYLKDCIWIGLWFLRRNDISLDWILQSLNKIDHSFNFCQFLLIFWWFSIFCTFSFSLIICHTIWYHYKSNFKY